MSWYYQYFLGVQDKQTKEIKPFGPYDCDGNLRPIIEKSSSFASELHNDFIRIPEEFVSAELRKEFEYEDYQGDKQFEAKYLMFNDLPDGDYIVRGYFPIEDHEMWVKEGDDSLFYRVIDPHTYNELMRKELIFGKNQPEKDSEGFEYTKPNASDYIYDAIPRYNSEEYEAELIRQVANMLFGYELYEKYNLVVIETEG